MDIQEIREGLIKKLWDEYYCEDYGQHPYLLDTQRCDAFADKILSCLANKGACFPIEGELPVLTYDEYMAIHSDWANSKETVENLLRRVALEAHYRILKAGYKKVKTLKEMMGEA